MVHLWVRAEERPDERRVGVTPAGVARLVARGFRVTVEDSRLRVFPTRAYRAAGATIAPAGSWRAAPAEAIIFGLKELRDDGTPLAHRHVMFGHAYKGQPAGRRLLARFRAGGGRLFDLEALVDADGRRVAAFGHWAGFAGAALTLMARAEQRLGGQLGPVTAFDSAEAMVAAARERLAAAADRPRVLIVGALGRVGRGAAELCARAGVDATRWDIAETAHGGPFPEVLAHEVFLNCILARPGCPVFVPAEAATAARRLTAIGDIACDPESAFSPIRVYSRATTWGAPVLRVNERPPLDVMAIDNLPSLLPRESSEHFAAQLLPHLEALDRLDGGVWARAAAEFDRHVAALDDPGPA